jgi:hypothetical protein
MKAAFPHIVSWRKPGVFLPFIEVFAAVIMLPVTAAYLLYL